MDLQKKLNILTGAEKYSDKDLSTSKVYNAPEDDPFNSPYFEEVVDRPVSFDDLSISNHISFNDTDNKTKKKKKHSDIFDDFEDVDTDIQTSNKNIKKVQQSKIYQKITKKMSTDTIAEFESFLNDDNNFDDEESEELKNELISMGRKYARDTGIDAATSEIAKIHSESEQKLNALYKDLSSDAVAIQKDIDKLRSMTRMVNSKALADLAAVKNSTYSTQLAIIKEKDAIKKAQFEMRMKEQAQKNASGDGSTDISTNTIKSLFGGGSLVNAVGGYGRVSGAVSSANSISGNLIDGDVDDDVIEQKYFSDDTEQSDEDRYCDAFLRYENDGVEYVLLVDDDQKPMDVIAEDRDGNTIPDYPMPSNYDKLQFNVNMQTSSATDDLHRQYKVRQV